MSNEYDFYGMGIRYATEGLLNLDKLAKEIGEKYGNDAKLEFESGIAMTIPTYSKTIQAETQIDKGETSAKTIEGVKNLRNNSYFGGSGVSLQYKANSSGHIVYNEPQSKGKAK